MSVNSDKLKALLRDLFQMDQADLDFGLYRIMNAKRDEIEKFLEADLLPQVKAELARHTNLDSGAKKAELDETIENAKRLGVNPDTVPKVLELRDELKKGGDLDALENEVFSHLYNFFRRYYHEGDFLSLRRYKEGVYAIPYEGEEVKLYWANHDQYYIKSTEYLRNYTFKLRDNRRVHFRVVEADTEADNNKPQNGKDRRFILVEVDPVVVENGELFIRFNYHADTRKQAELNTAAVTALLGNATLTDWLSALGELRPTEKNSGRTLLAKHLDDFTARYTFDYFIHKDVGGFLRRELDFFIKNEIMHLDDVEDEAAPKVELYLSKIKALRKIAHKVIAFLEQLETFQKKLWLKKKFVVETNYCVTLDRVPEELYPQIIENKAQIEEWKRLFSIQEIEKSTINPGFSEHLSVDFLKSNPLLLLDTKHFDESFTLRLLAAVSNITSMTDGLLVNGDNFHALALLHQSLQGQTDSIFIDPPYNTGGDEFIYKDGYRSSSWVSMMFDRLQIARSLMSDDGSIAMTIDGNEAANLRLLLDHVFGEDNFVANICWQKLYTVKNSAKYLSEMHDSIFLFARNKPEWRPRLLIRSEDQDEDYGNPDDDPNGPWISNALQARNYYSEGTYSIKCPGGRVIEGPPPGTYWRMKEQKFWELDGKGQVWWGKNKNSVPRIKKYLKDIKEGVVPVDLWLHQFAGTNAGAKTETRDMIGEDVTGLTPKPVLLMNRVVQLTCGDTGLMIDFFAGSGTTAHAVIDLNRSAKSKRRYIMVEAGRFFDTVLIPRVKKAVYSSKWNDGRPVARDGIGQIFKYVRLESYEDCLNNLELKRTKAQDDLLTQAKDFREDYTLRYMLDVETRGSASLLNIQKFIDPFRYKLKVSTGTVGETKEVNVDLVETFNWLIGLKVKHIDHIRNVRVVEGTNPQGDRVLILWRSVAEVPNDKLDEWFKTQGYNTRDQEYDLIYVNGDNNLENLRRGDQTWKVRLIEEDFHRLMWECQDV